MASPNVAQAEASTLCSKNVPATDRSVFWLELNDDELIKRLLQARRDDDNEAVIRKSPRVV